MESREFLEDVLERCGTPGGCGDDCPNRDREWKEAGRAACRDFAEGDTAEVPVTLIERTLALLRQEPVKPEIAGFAGMQSESEMTYFYVCGECGGAIERGDRYCKHCGKKVKWA